MKKLVYLPLVIATAFGLVGCNAVEIIQVSDPNGDFVNEALGYYQTLREKEGVDEEAEYKAWYYDSSLLKGVVFNSLEDYEYLGVINLQNLNFSHTSDKYFLDVPNYEVGLDLESGNITFPDFVTNPINFLKDLPLVLVDYSGNVYSKFDNNGDLNASATSDNYDPTLFYIKDFKYDLGIDSFEEFNMDYTDKQMAIMKRDIYGFIKDIIDENFDLSTLPFDFDLAGILIKSYNRANDLSGNELAPETLTIPSTFNGYEVVVGPMGLEALFTTQSIKDVQNIVLEEGISELAMFAFNDSNIKSLKLPSSMKKLGLSSLANLELNSLYISDSDTAMNILSTVGLSATIEIDLSEIVGGEGPSEITISAPFFNTSISEELIFEHYDNVNIGTFPYIDINFARPIGEMVKYVGSDGVEKYDTLEEAYKANDAINPLYQIKDQENNVLETGNLTSISSTQTLYLAHQLTSGDFVGTILGLTNNSYRSTNPIMNNPGESREVETYTLKLSSDLEVNGSIVVGGTVGSHTDYEGLVNGNYAAIDLNGHTLTIKNGGLVDCNGKIYDSSSSLSGRIIVEDGGTLKANLATDSNGYDSYLQSLGNRVTPFNNFVFYDLEVRNISIRHGASLIGKTLTVDNISYSRGNEIYFIDTEEENKPIFLDQGRDGEGIVLFQDDITNHHYELYIYEDVTVYDYVFIDGSTMSEYNITYTTEMGMFLALTNDNLDVIMAEKDSASVVSRLTNNINIKLYSGELNFNNNTRLVIDHKFIVYDTAILNFGDIDSVSSFSYLDFGTSQNLSFAGKIDITNSSSTVYDNIYNSLANSGSLRVTVSTDELIHGETYHLRQHMVYGISLDYTSPTQNMSYLRVNSGYFYRTVNGEVTIYDLNGNVLGTKSSSSAAWIIYPDGESNPSITTDQTGTYFTDYDDSNNTTHYVLNDNGTFTTLQTENQETHAYYEGGIAKYIRYNGSLIEGSLLQDQNAAYLLFYNSNINRYFAYLEGERKYVHLFENRKLVAVCNDTDVPSTTDYVASNYSGVYYIYGNSLNGSISSTNYDFVNRLVKTDNSQAVIYVGSDLTPTIVTDFTTYIDRDMVSNGNRYYLLMLNDRYYQITSSEIDASGNIDLNQNVYYVVGEDQNQWSSRVALWLNSDWEVGMQYDTGNSEGFYFYYLPNRTDPNRNFAVGDENHENVGILLKSGYLEVKKENIDSTLTDVLPADQDVYSAYRYITINGEYYIFRSYEIEGQENDQLEMIHLASAPKYTEYNDEEINIRNIAGLLGMSCVIYNADGSTSVVTYYVDFSSSIAVGENSESAFALATYNEDFSLDDYINGPIVPIL